MKIDNLSYEEALKELKEGLEKLKDEEISLEESIVTFKESMELYRYCNDILDRADGEIKIILKEDNLSEEDFDLEG